MTTQPQTDAQVMECLERFLRTRDLADRDAVTLYVFNKWAYRVESNRLFSSDPMQDIDDMRQVFFEGILGAVDKLDDRGYPLFHLSQRGFWAVASKLRVAAIRRHTYQLCDVSELLDKPDTIEASRQPDIADHETVPDFSDAVISRLEAKRVVERAKFHLNGRAQEVFEAIISGECGDPTDGNPFNQRLAGVLGVSEQRASQLKNKLREQLEAQAA